MKFDLMSRNFAVLFLTISASLSAAPRLGISTSSISTVNVQPGANGPTQTVEAFNLGDGTLNLAASASASWLSATVGAQRACTTRSGNCIPISIALNTSSLAPGMYTEYVTLSDPNAVDSPQDIAVNVNVAGVPSSLNVYVSPSGGPGSTQVIPVYTAGTGVHATVTTQAGGNWLQFLSGTNGFFNYPSPYIIQVAAPLGLAPGTYTGTIVLTGSTAASDNKTINVTMTVTTSPIVQTSSIMPVRLGTSPGGGIQYGSVSLSNIGQGTLTIAGATSSNSFLTPTVSGNTIVLAADPTNLAAGVYNATVTVQSNAANNSAITIPVQFAVGAASTPPLISTGGIVNIANGAQEAVAQGDIVAVYGTQLAPAGTSALNSSTPLATTLGSVQVLVNNVPAPLFYVSPGQINFQVPYSVAVGSTATVQVVSNGTTSNLRPLNIVAAAPRLLFFQQFIAGNYGIIVNNGDGSLTLPTGTAVGSFKTHPAKPGDTIVIYGIGFGQTNPSATAGQPAAGLQSVGTVNVTFGGGFIGRPTSVAAGYAGLTPTAVGLYQLNVTIPADTPLGAMIPVTAVANGLQSNPVYLAITTSGQ